jgi:hypothetical protein
MVPENVSSSQEQPVWNTPKTMLADFLVFCAFMGWGALGAPIISMEINEYWRNWKKLHPDAGGEFWVFHALPLFNLLIGVVPLVLYMIYRRKQLKKKHQVRK